MIAEVGRYALINAKLRARISNMLSDDFFSSLIKCRTAGEMLQLLRGTPFAELASVYEQTGDLKSVELVLYKKEAGLFRELEPYLPPRVITVVQAFAAGYEIENLKNALRLFFDHVFRKRSIDDAIHYLMRERILTGIPYETIINSVSLDEVANALAATPYGGIVATAAPEVERMQSLFPLSVAFDRYYYRRLTEAVADLDSRDRIIAQRLVGIEIDLQNISWIIRFRTFYNLPYEAVADLIIPGGFSIRGSTLQDIYRSPQLTAPLETMIRKNYPGIAALASVQHADQSSRLTMIERILEQITLEEVHRIMRGYPFTIGIILAYFILKRLEIRRIRTVLNAGFFNLSKERTASLL
ncbi:MAG: V-type ATPase subunit [Chitinispirillaceae bacterium]|nr:V-type ATPase subunit [Chitinispirillaceae bacterium]